MVQPDGNLPGNEKPEMIQQMTQNFINLLAWRDFETLSSKSCSLWHTGIFSHCEKISLGINELFIFSAQFFFAPLSWQTNSNRKHRNDRKCHTLIILVNASIQMHQQGVAWMDQRNFHSGSVSLYRSSTFETLTHRVLLIVSETLILASPRANAKQQRFI